MALNLLGDELRQPDRPVPTLPKISLPVDDDQAVAAEEAIRIAECRTIRAGRDAWALVRKAESFEGWKAIGAALAVGKAHALRVTGANRAWGSAYSRAFNNWVKQHHFDRMPKSLRSVAVEMHENILDIEAWRSTLSEKQKQRLQGPLHNVRRWRRETATGEAKRIDDVKRAEAAWRNFMRCMSDLSSDQAAPLWQAVQTEILRSLAQ